MAAISVLNKANRSVVFLITFMLSHSFCREKKHSLLRARVCLICENVNNKYRRVFASSVARHPGHFRNDDTHAWTAHTCREFNYYVRSCVLDRFMSCRPPPPSLHTVQLPCVAFRMPMQIHLHSNKLMPVAYSRTACANDWWRHVKRSTSAAERTLAGPIGPRNREHRHHSAHCERGCPWHLVYQLACSGDVAERRLCLRRTSSITFKCMTRVSRVPLLYIVK